MPTLESAPHAVAARQRRSRRRERPALLRPLLLAAIGPLVLGYLAVAVVLAVVTGLAANSAFSASGVLTAAAPAWLAAWQVPLLISGHELTVLPLLPTLLLVLLTARAAAGAAARIDAVTPAEAAPVLATIGGAHAVFGLALAVLAGGPSVSASPAVAFFVCGVLATVGAALGVVRRCGLAEAALRRADDAVRGGIRIGLVAVAGLVGVAALVTAGALVGSYGAVVAGFRADAPGLGNGAGMFALCLGYLPNVLVAVLGFVTGPGFGLGALSASPLRFHPGPVPPVPLLAVVPGHGVVWWAALALLPCGVGVLMGFACRRLDVEGPARLRAVGVAALVAGVSFLVLAGLSGGSFGGGPFDPVRVPAGALALAVFGWLAVPAALVAWLPTADFGLVPVPRSWTDTENLADEDEFDDDEPDDLADEPEDHVEESEPEDDPDGADAD